jgi:hypothetical protein
MAIRNDQDFLESITGLPEFTGKLVTDQDYQELVGRLPDSAIVDQDYLELICWVEPAIVVDQDFLELICKLPDEPTEPPVPPHFHPQFHPLIIR